MSARVFLEWPLSSESVSVVMAPPGVLKFFDDFCAVNLPKSRRFIPSPPVDAGKGTESIDLDSLNLDTVTRLQLLGVLLAAAEESPLLGPCVRLGALNPAEVTFLKYGRRGRSHVLIHSDATGAPPRVATMVLTIRAPTRGGETVFPKSKGAVVGTGVPKENIEELSSGVQVKHHPGMVTTFWSRVRPPPRYFGLHAPVNPHAEHYVRHVEGDAADSHLGFKFVIVVFFHFDGDLMTTMRS